MGIENLLLAYPSIVSQICLAAEMQELPGIDQLIELTNIIDMGLIWDIANPWPKK